ncbi:hypothetical protein SAMN05444972_107104 [Marininema halotolerans]|uniref:Uncharacterized protein n=1 Tax=Marininema halotolerans TaxID=1155944 RepID=A0A1I6SHU3_9BACL|nr:hypothetical protein SAMN05444972_107104 [Marininema halotolerans]
MKILLRILVVVVSLGNRLNNYGELHDYIWNPISIVLYSVITLLSFVYLYCNGKSKEVIYYLTVSIIILILAIIYY